MLGHHPGTDGHTYTGRQQRPHLYTASRRKNPENDGNVQIDFAVATNGTRMAKLQNLSPPRRKHSKLCVRPIRIAFLLVRPLLNSMLNMKAAQTICMCYVDQK